MRIGIMGHAPHIEALAEFAADTRFDAIPAEVVSRARWILIDCIGCIVAGNRSAELDRLADVEAAHKAAEEAQVLGTWLQLPRCAAATLNGIAGTWLDLDEGNLHTKGHAGIQIVPTIWAESEAEGSTPQDLLRALILGYEIGCRVYGATSARLAVHPHGTYGPLAAAVALACMRGFEAPEMAQVIGLAAGLGVPASRQTLADGATIRNAFTGTSARAAFHALDLAVAGFAGEYDPLSSVFGQIYGTAFDAEFCLAGLGTEWRILRNYFKLHPSGRYAHSALDLVDDILRDHGPLDANEIVAIELRSYFMATTMANPEVTTAFGTRFSIPFCVAARLLGAEGGLDDPGEAVFAREDVHELAHRVKVTEDEDATAAYPDRQISTLRITLADGRELSAHGTHIRGEAENPHSEAQLAAKFLALTKPSWGEDAAAILAGLRTMAIDCK